MNLQQAMMKIFEAEYVALSLLCRRIGFAEVMQKTSQIWQSTAGAQALAIGPSVSYCRPCPHPQGQDPEHPCEWCGGSGWLTKRVYETLATTGVIDEPECEKSEGDKQDES